MRYLKRFHLPQSSWMVLSTHWYYMHIERRKFTPLIETVKFIMTVGFKVELTHDPSEGEESVKRSGRSQSIFMIWAFISV